MKSSTGVKISALILSALVVLFSFYCGFKRIISANKESEFERFEQYGIKGKEELLGQGKRYIVIGGAAAFLAFDLIYALGVLIDKAEEKNIYLANISASLSGKITDRPRGGNTQPDVGVSVQGMKYNAVPSEQYGALSQTRPVFIGNGIVKCPLCGKEQPADRSLCINCAAEFEK